MGTSVLFAGISLILVMVYLAIFVIMLVAAWKVFVKMGLPGWYCIIPFFNVYVVLRKVWTVKLPFTAYVAGVVLSYLSTFVISSKTGDYLGFASILILIVFTVMFNNYVAKAFNKSTGFTVGLVLLPVVFWPILGFGSAYYMGNRYMEGRTLR